MLSCRAFGVAFGERVIFPSLDLELEPGSISILSGPGECGKTTLLRTLAGLNQPNRRFRLWGEVRYLGRPLGDGPLPWLARQDARLMQSTVLEALTEALRARPSRPPTLGRERIEQELQALGIGELVPLLSSRGIELPTVLQRALPIVVGALRGAPLLLLDEPTTRLSVEDAERILDLIGAAARTCTVLAVLPDARQADRIGTHRVSMAGDASPARAASATEPAGGSGDAPPAAPSAQAAPDAGKAAGGVRGGSGLELAARLLETPQPEPRAPQGFRWLIPGRLAATAMPGAEPGLQDALTALAQVGVTRLISLSREDIPLRSLARQGLGSLHLPVRDGEPPTVAQTNMLLIRMQGMLDRGEVLAVHCSDGIGRTGTVLAAWLIREGGLSADEAIVRLRRLDPGFVGSAEQEGFLHAYEDSLLKT